MLAHLRDVLEFLCETVDEQQRYEAEGRFRRTLGWERGGRPPLVISYPLPRHARFLPFPPREVFDHPEKMLYNELVYAFETSIVLHGELGDDLPMTVRANFGTVLTASMFGASVEQRDDNPPWVVSQDRAPCTLASLADHDPYDFRKGWIPRAARAMQFYQHALDEYPLLRRQLRIVLPDLQGPIDNLELIRGSEVLLELVTEPEAVEHALETLAAAQIALARYFGRWTTEPAMGYCHQHAVMLSGNILLRNDTSIMLSPEMYRTQIAPHDERIMRDLNGGAIHSCGNIAHLVDAFLSLPSLRALDIGQSELNDMERLYSKAAEKRIPLIRVAVNAADILSGKALRRYPTGAVLLHRAKDVEGAKRMAASWKAEDHRKEVKPDIPPENVLAMYREVTSL